MGSVLPMVRNLNGTNGGGFLATAQVFVLHRDADAVPQIQEAVQQAHASVITVDSLHGLLEKAHGEGFGAVVVDYTTFHDELSRHLTTFVKDRPGFPVIVWSSQLEVPVSVEAIKAGAIDVLRKPQDNAALATVLINAIKVGRERQDQASEYRTVVKRFSELSANERSVLTLVMQGRTNKEIASRLDCSLRTVEARRQRILRVMQTENAIELAVVLSRHGLMDSVVGSPVAANNAPHWGERLTNVS